MRLGRLFQSGLGPLLGSSEGGGGRVRVTWARIILLIVLLFGLTVDIRRYRHFHKLVQVGSRHVQMRLRSIDAPLPTSCMTGESPPH